MSCWPGVVPLLTTRWLYWGWDGGIKGTDRGHRGSQGALGLTYEKWRQSIAKYSWKLKTLELRLTGPNLVLLLVTRCLYLWGTSELRSTAPNIVLVLATRCLYWGVHLTECQHDPKANQMSSWPDVVLLLVTRCLYWRVHLSSGQLDLSTGLGHQISVLGVHLI